MKKRWLALLTAVAALAVMPGRAEEYSLEEKLAQQIRESAYAATVTLETEGDHAPALLDRLSLALEHSNRLGHSETVATLLLDGESVGETTVRSGGGMTGFASDLLAGAEQFYIVPADWDWTDALTRGQNGWPPLWPMVLSAARAGEDWQKRAEPMAQEMETALGLWLNEYAQADIGTGEDGTDYTELRFSVPGRAVQSEAEALLHQLYAHEEWLMLLREVASPAAADAYLQPASEGPVTALLREAAPEGDVEILRRYGTDGRSLLEMISLPLPGGGKIEFTAENEKTMRAVGETKDGWAFDLQWQTEEEGVSGSVRFRRGEGEETAFDFRLTWQIGQETYNEETQKNQKTMSAALTVTPLNAGPEDAWMLTADMTLFSGLRKQSATHLNGDVTWRRGDGTTVKAHLESKTASPFQITVLDPEGGVRLDQMDGENLLALPGQWLESAEDFWSALEARAGEKIAP